MANETNNMTKEERLEYWAGLEKECNSRPKDMTIVEWCEQHGITKATYYYYLRQLKAAGIGSKKSKSKSKKKSKKNTVTEPAVVEDITEVEEEITEVAEPTQEPVEEPVTEVVEPAEEPTKEVVEEVAEPAKEPVEESIPVTEPAKEVQTPAEEPASTIDITIGSTVIHVNDNTSPELLSMVVQTVVSNMKKPD